MFFTKRIYYFLLIFFSALSYAKHQVVDLTVAYDTVNFTGYPARAITVNHQIPAPTLRFKEGDTVTINVHNHLDKETAIHWHGMILPWQMDGVMNLTQKGIPPGGTFVYHYKLRQSGTYWYHAHAGLQEQEGLYGAYIIEPKSAPPFSYNKDFEIVLSDWKNTKADHIQANLKKTGEYYAADFPMQPSLFHFIKSYQKASKFERKKLWMDYKMMQFMRMGIFDFSDIAYDAFLLNGHSNKNPWLQQVQVGDVVRLRFIAASANTFFRIKIPGATMQMVHIQGNDVRPYTVEDFLIGPGETNDLLIKIEKYKPYIIYAESFDKVGSAIGALITTANQSPDYHSIKPFPDPKPATRTKMKNEKARGLMPMKHMGMQSQLHQQPKINTIPEAKLSQPSKNTQNASKQQEKYVTIGTKYQNLKARYKTNNPNRPIYKTVKMNLFGFMDRYIWFINGVPAYNAKPINLLPNKRYRLVFINNSMMHHPLHLHGHWMILRNGHGVYDPLLHTIDVPPGSMVTADLDTDASGQWFFHCHMLNHMISGLARTFQYNDIVDVAEHKQKPAHIIKETGFYNRPIVRVDEERPIPLDMVKNAKTHPEYMWAGTFVDFGADFDKNRQTLTYHGLYGYDFNKLQLFINDAEMSKGAVENADIDVFYWHLLNQFWAVKAGANYFYKPSQTPYWQPGIGIEGLMYYFIENNTRLYYHNGALKADIEFARNTQITNNFFLGISARATAATKTIVQDQIGSGLNQTWLTVRPNYRIMPGISAFVEYEYVKYFNNLKHIRKNAGASATENSLFIGLSFII
jgi:FtsP/CotA-like multicopper oxidase with cupredoxin domain